MSNQLYNQRLKEAMNWLAAQPDTIFLGQAVRYGGTGCYESLTEVPDHKKIEFPIAENFQIGVSTGLAMQGFVPVSVIPRWNFLLCATDQIINHLDKTNTHTFLIKSSTTANTMNICFLIRWHIKTNNKINFLNINPSC